MCRLAPAGGRFLGHAQKGCLDEGWEVTNSGAEAENQGKGQ